MAPYAFPVGRPRKHVDDPRGAADADGGGLPRGRALEAALGARDGRSPPRPRLARAGDQARGVLWGIM
jgi:hypothetical protein